ncbi:MAG TPA: HNH endonuclease [Candidatus Agathobaculum intestinigallinarum]|nr:HNH endonuclease [Candidatus Agathobaculum intestinigallinarum]
MNKRRKLSRSERIAVFDKTRGHCAYCGCELEFADMQIDHVVPINGWSEQGSDTLDNMLPACRSCNHYKSRSTLEGFRKNVENMPTVLMRDSVTYRNAVRFGLVTPTPHPVRFYFEDHPPEGEEDINV